MEDESQAHIPRIHGRRPENPDKIHQKEDSTAWETCASSVRPGRALAHRLDLPAKVPWPRACKRSLFSIAQINPGELDSCASDNRKYRLPKSGCLFFFYETSKIPWGHSPADAKYSAVLFAASRTIQVSSTCGATLCFPFNSDCLLEEFK